MIFQTNEDGTISVDGGTFTDRAEFSLSLIGRSGPLLETTIRLTTREGTALYRVVGANTLGWPSLTAELVSVELTP